MNRSLLSVCSTLLLGIALAPFSAAQSGNQVSLQAGESAAIEQGIRWIPYQGDGNIFITNVSGKNVFQTDPDNGQHELYTDIDDTFIKDGQPTREVWVSVEYYDSGTDTLAVDYDSGPDGIPAAFKNAAVIQKTDSGEFRTVLFHLTDVSFNNRQQGVSDLRVDDRGDGAESVSQIIVSKTALQIPNGGTVSGKITDAVSNAGVTNVRLRANNGMTATTAADGTFSFTLQAGSYTLQITRPGYLKLDDQNVTITAGGTTPLNLTLQPYGKDAVTFTAAADGPTEDGLTGLPQEGDGFFQIEEKNGSPTVRTGPDTDPFPDSFLYIRVDDNFLLDGQPTQEVWIEMEYLDQGTAPFSINYDSVDNPYAGGATVSRTNTGTWKTHVWHLKDVRFANRENGAADFRISDNGGGDANDLYIRRVAVSVKPPASFGTLTGTVTNASNGSVIVDARVTAANGESTLTDAQGKFTLQLPAGVQTLTVTGFGYTTLTVPNVTVTAGQTTTAPAIALTPTVVRTSVSLSAKSGSPDETGGIRWVERGEHTDGYGTVTTWEGREVIQTGPSAEPFIDRFLYGEIDNTFLFQGKPTREVWFTIDYWDNGTTPFRLDYDAVDSPFKSTPSVNRTDTGTWKTHTWHLTDANFANREQNVADFRIFDGSDVADENDLYISKVTVSTVNPDPTAGTAGDVNADSQVNVSDAVLVLRSIVGQETFTDVQRTAADVDKSNTVDVNDAVQILRKSVGLPVNF